MILKNKIRNLIKSVKPLHPFLRFYRKTLWHFRKDIPGTVFINKSIKVDTSNYITKHWVNNKLSGNDLIHEPYTTEIFKDLLDRSDVFFDIGAHIGYYTLLASDYGVESVAFDIDKGACNELKKHLKNNNFEAEVVSRPVGLGEKISWDTLSLKSNGESVVLDDFCRKKDLWPDLIKMDIEGFEVNALKGAKTVLSKKPIIILAFHPNKMNKFGHDADIIRSLLGNFNYITYQITKDGLVKSELDNSGNYLCRVQ